MSTPIPAGSKPRVFVLGTLLRQDERLFPLPFGHVRAPSVREADAVFIWVGDLAAEELFLAGQVFMLFKPVYLANGKMGNPDLPSYLKELRIIKHASAFTLRGGYESLMADLDVTLPTADTWSWITANGEGKCAGCGSLYAGFTGIAKVQRAGGTFYYHRDCYERIKDPETVNAALITDRLVEALRKDNARLEHELEELKEKSHADDRVRLRGSRAGKR